MSRNRSQVFCWLYYADRIASHYSIDGTCSDKCGRYLLCQQFCRRRCSRVNRRHYDFVNEDITLRPISGDYALVIHSDGEHTLTVDNPNGSAINVKMLKSVKHSQGTVNLTINGTNVSVVGSDGIGVVANSGSISVDSDYLFAQCAGQSGDGMI